MGLRIASEKASPARTAISVEDLVVGAIYRFRTGTKGIQSLRRVIAFEPDYRGWPGGRVTYVSLRPDGSVSARGRWAGEYFVQRIVDGPVEPD